MKEYIVNKKQLDKIIENLSKNYMTFQEPKKNGKEIRVNPIYLGQIFIAYGFTAKKFNNNYKLKLGTPNLFYYNRIFWSGFLILLIPIIASLSPNLDGIYVLQHPEAIVAPFILLIFGYFLQVSFNKDIEKLIKKAVKA